MQNNRRFDLSDYLIHFFRDVDLESNNYIHFPEYAGFNNICEDTKCSALFLMRCALRNTKLVASWSYRNGKRTIYGPYPAICFTEMPLAAFLQASKERKEKGENIGEYAFMLPKKEMFKIGARPVIYGLSEDNYFKYSTAEKKYDDEKIIDPTVLPLKEQYRYVNYNPIRTNLIDWTHEREWRWAYKDDISEYMQEIIEYGIVDNFDILPGLDFSLYPILGVGVVIPKNEDINKILFDILTLIDSKKINVEMFKFVVSTENIELYDILNPDDFENFIKDNIIDINKYFDIDTNEEKMILENINKIINTIVNKYKNDKESYPNEIGKSWVWIVDNFEKLTRVLIKNNMLYVNNEGKYLLEIDGIEFYLLRKQEKICKEIASEISKLYKLNAAYFSVCGHQDPDNVPYYTDFVDNDHYYYNLSKIK